ncbi:MAG TPA: bacillithiol biosynthesis cysteine-adding enzyme BshC [Bacteroidota bacterium]
MASINRWIDFHDLPATAGGFSSLFLDYLRDGGAVERFFPAPFRTGAGFESVMAAVNSHAPDRVTLTQVLNEQNTAFGAGQRAMENIALLARPETYAVVTGQQVGVLGGPLYTVLKAITAIKLAARLKVKYPDRNFVPVFWLEGEDHDFQEVNKIVLLDQEGQPTAIEYNPGGVPPERNLGPVGEIIFDEWIVKTVDRVAEVLPKTDFTEALLAAVRSCYQPGKSFNQAFAGWLTNLFRDHGLVFISVNNARLKRLVSPLFVRELSEFPRVSQLVISQSAELEQAYHAQIKTKSINLFLFHKGGRYLIEPREHDFSLKGTRHFLTREELLRIAAESPEMLSPNVVLRPIVQDTLLPTVAYVAGPSEIAYHAQLQPVYEHFGTVRPVIYPRASASIVEERVARVAEKYGLEVQEFFGERDKLVARVVGQIAEVKVDQIFENADREILAALNELRFGVGEVDPTLLAPLDATGGKIRQQLGVIKEKTVAAQQRQHETAVRQVERSLQSLMPNGSLQERELSIIYFMNKYGPELPGWLLRELEIDGYKHQLLPH